jgi:hypothetical protein
MNELILNNLPARIDIDNEWLRTKQVLLDESDGLIIDNQPSYLNAEIQLKRITGHSNALEARRKELDKPFRDAAAAIKKLADDARSGLETRKETLKRKMAEFIVEQNRIRAEAEELARQEAAATAAELDDNPFKEVAPATDAIIPAAPQRLMTTVYDEYNFVIDCADLVPREFCIPDERKIREYIRANKDMAQIAGVTIVKETKVKSR